MNFLYLRPSNNPILIKLLINYQNVNFLFDTGSGLSFINQEIAHKINLKYDKTNGPYIKLIDGKTKQLRFHVSLNITYSKLNFKQEFFILKNLSHHGILGLDFFYKVKDILSEEYNDLRLIQIIEDHSKFEIIQSKYQNIIKANTSKLCEIFPLKSTENLVLKVCDRI